MMPQPVGRVRGVVRALLVLCAAGALGALSGCYTVAGFGRDIESLGDGLEDLAISAAE